MIGERPTEMYVDDAALLTLLAANGVEATVEDLNALTGRAWDGERNDHKWYEALTHFGIDAPGEGLPS